MHLRPTCQELVFMSMCWITCLHSLQAKIYDRHGLEHFISQSVIEEKVTSALWSSVWANILEKENKALLGDSVSLTGNGSRKGKFQHMSNQFNRNKTADCKADSFMTKKGQCQECSQCGPSEVLIAPCTTQRDTVCKPLTQRYTRCVEYLRRKVSVQNPKRHSDLLKKKMSSYRLQRCFKYLANYILQLKVRRSINGKLRLRHKRNATITQDPEEVENDKESFHTLDSSKDKLRNDVQKDYQTTRKKFTNSREPEMMNNPGESNSAVSVEGTASWVYITIGVAVVMLIMIILALTLMYHRRKIFLQQGTQLRKSAPTLAKSAQHSMYDNSTDIETEQSKSTVLTYLSRDSEKTRESVDLESYELMPISSLTKKYGGRDESELAEYQCLVKDASSGKECDRPLPHVTVISGSTVPPQASGHFLLRGCISSMEKKEDRDVSRNHFSTRRDDGNKLRGGNGDFQRRYVDVDYIHNEFELTWDRGKRGSEVGYGGRRFDHRRSLGTSPESDYHSQNISRSKKDRIRNESNASSSASHHSARSYISIPPTSPSENYIEAGSDDMSLRSEHSTPAIKMEWLTKTLKMDGKNELRNYQASFGTQTDTDIVAPKHKTVFGTSWQFGGTFTSRGGMMQAKDSDVCLMVAANSVPKGMYMDIYGAVFTDTVEIRKKFDFPSEESLISPLVEYHAVPGGHFWRPVCVQLPHPLPEDFDTGLIKVYTFTVDDHGKISLAIVPVSSQCNCDDLTTDVYWEKGCDGCSVQISTIHFSGYFCTLCDTSSLPSICTMVFGSHVQISPSRREVRVILYIWDRRLTIKDYLERFRKQESDVDRQLLTDMQVPLLDAASSNSHLVMKMEVMGEDGDRQSWRHVSRPDGSRPLFKPLQVRKLSEIVHCCRQTDPIRLEWALENMPRQIPSTVFQCCIDIMHVPESIKDYETAMREDIDDLMRTFYVRDLKVMTYSAQELKPNQNFQPKDLRRTLSEVMDVSQTEKVCHEFGVTSKDIGNFKKKYLTEEKYHIGLMEECLRRHGEEKFIQQLPLILERLCMTRVLSKLEDKKVVVRDLADFAGLPDSPVDHGRKSSSFEPPPTKSGADNDEATKCKVAGRESSCSPPQRRRSVSREGPQNPGYQQQMSEKSDEVFIYNRPASEDSHNCYRNGYGKQQSAVKGFLTEDGTVKSRYVGQEGLLLGTKESSSSGSDSVLRDSSLSCRNSSLSEPHSVSCELTLCSSRLAHADPKDFAQPYPEEFLDEFQKQTYKKELMGPLYPRETYSNDESEREERHVSDSGPYAIPPSSCQSISSCQQKRPPTTARSGGQSQVQDRDETSKKEVYGIHTVV